MLTEGNHCLVESEMSAIKYRVTLSEEEVAMLDAKLRNGKSAASKQTRARILLKVAGRKDAEIISALSVSATMVGHILSPVAFASPWRGRTEVNVGQAISIQNSASGSRRSNSFLTTA